MRHKLIAIIFIALALFIIKPVYSENVNLLDKTNVEENVIQNAEEENADIIKTTTPKTAEIIEKSAAWPYQNDLKDTVSPQPKQELFRVLIYFLKAMLWVGIFSIIILLLAVMSKKFYGIPNTQDTKNQPETLKASNNEDEALKSFLSKTQ